MGCSLDVKGFIKTAQIRRRDLQCACTFGTISVYRYATQMQQCRILFSEAVDKSDTLHFNIHGWRVHGDCSHVYAMTRKRVFGMSDAISWC